MDEMKYDVLHQIHPMIRKYVTYIWTHGKTGTCSGTIQILRIASTVKNEEGIDSKYANKLTFSIPYAGCFLEWEVKFCSDNLTFAPDFDLGDDEFLGLLTAELAAKKLPSWSQWDPKDPGALHKVLMELLYQYKNHQLCLLQADRFSRLQFEFSALIGETGVKKDDVEVLIEPSGLVHFLIALSIDFSCLPTDFLKNPSTVGKHVGAPCAVLMITFPRLDASNVQPHLFISPSVEQCVLGFGDKQIPPFPTNGCLIDYVPTIKKLLQDKIQSVVDNYTLKRKYVVQLLAEFPTNILEWDNVNFTKASLLFETDHFYWVIIITINNNFPKEKPKWSMRSIYHTSFDEPVTEVLHDYPYSPRWSPNEMIVRAIKYAVEKIPQFQMKKKSPKATESAPATVVTLSS